MVGLFSYSGPAALEAIKQAGRTGQIQVVGFDESEATQAAIKAESMHSSILQDTSRIGYEAIEVLANEARGIKPGPAENTPVVSVPVTVMTVEKH